MIVLALFRYDKKCNVIFCVVRLCFGHVNTGPSWRYSFLTEFDTLPSVQHFPGLFWVIIILSIEMARAVAKEPLFRYQTNLPGLQKITTTKRTKKLETFIQTSTKAAHGTQHQDKHTHLHMCVR